MTPLDRAYLLQIAKLVVAASVETDPEVREVALEEAVRRLVGIAKGKPVEVERKPIAWRALLVGWLAGVVTAAVVGFIIGWLG